MGFDEFGAVDLADLAHLEHFISPVEPTHGRLSSIDDHAFYVAELVAAGDHDAVAFLRAFQDLNRAQAAGAGADRALDRDVAVHHVGAADRKRKLLNSSP